MGGIAIMLGWLLLILMLDEKKSTIRKGWVIGIIFAFFLISVISPLMFYIYGEKTGLNEAQGTPLTSLKIGKQYNVLAYAHTERDGFLIVSPVSNKNILLYTAPLKKLPDNLSVGDTVIFTAEQELVIIES